MRLSLTPIKRRYFDKHRWLGPSIPSKDRHDVREVVFEQDADTGDWAVWCPELPGCASAGETQEEALKNIKEAITLYLEPDRDG